MKRALSPFSFLVLTLFAAEGLCAAEIPTVEWKRLSDKDISPEARAALSFQKELWKHAETGHFIYHFTDAKEAETVWVHAEVYYRWVKELFGVTEDEWTRKVHIFVFQEEAVWKDFLLRAQPKLQGDAYTSGWELFIRRDPYWLAPMKTLAHEITHVILFRFLDGPIPLFLNEGFAEFVGYRALAMQMGVSEFDIRVVKLLPPDQYLPLKELIKMTSYPKDKIEIFYRESELLVRHLILDHDGRRFYDLLRKASRGQDFEDILKEIYGMDLENFEEKFKAFAVTGDT